MIRANVLLLLVLGSVTQAPGSAYRYRDPKPGYPPPYFPTSRLMPPPMDPQNFERSMRGEFLPSPIPLSALVHRDGRRLLSTGPVPLALATPRADTDSTTNVGITPWGNAETVPFTTYWPGTYPRHPMDLLPPPVPRPPLAVAASRSPSPDEDREFPGNAVWPIASLRTLPIIPLPLPLPDVRPPFTSNILW
uniref:Putative conserved secreted protein n=1 Tax=Rhipicephalus microplus TaxID=6941 RepID=A0A6G5A6W2_RHIMP